MSSGVKILLEVIILAFVGVVFSGGNGSNVVLDINYTLKVFEAENIVTEKGIFVLL